MRYFLLYSNGDRVWVKWLVCGQRFPFRLWADNMVIQVLVVLYLSIPHSWHLTNYCLVFSIHLTSSWRLFSSTPVLSVTSAILHLLSICLGKSFHCCSCKSTYTHAKGAILWVEHSCNVSHAADISSQVQGPVTVRVWSLGSEVHLNEFHQGFPTAIVQM